MKVASSGVSPATGLTTLTRMRSGASSTAIVRETLIIAALLPLYQQAPDGAARRPWTRR
jgi:hypothetical protein